jgi:hypothetical protein
VTAALALESAPADVVITPRAASDLHWLGRELGKRYRGWNETNDPIAGPVELVLRRSSGKELAFYGSLETAARAARRAVEEAAR